MTRKEWEALVEYTLNIGRQMLELSLIHISEPTRP